MFSWSNMNWNLKKKKSSFTLRIQNLGCKDIQFIIMDFVLERVCVYKTTKHNHWSILHVLRHLRCLWFVYVLPHLAILTRLTGTQVLATVDTLTENKRSVNIIVLRQIGLLNLRNDWVMPHKQHEGMFIICGCWVLGHKHCPLGRIGNFFPPWNSRMLMLIKQCHQDLHWQLCEE